MLVAAAYASHAVVIAQNVDRRSLDDERSRRTFWLPIGLDLRSEAQGEDSPLAALATYYDALAVPRGTPRTPRVLVSWTRDSETSRRFARAGFASRRDLFDQAVERSGLADVVTGSRAAVWAAMASYAFVASPIGAGFDCFRTWEGLFFGAIVIAQRSPLEAEFTSKNLPVVFVDDFNFTQADLDAWAARHAPLASADDPRLKRDTYLRVGPASGRSPRAGGASTA